MFSPELQLVVKTHLTVLQLEDQRTDTVCRVESLQSEIF